VVCGTYAARPPELGREAVVGGGRLQHRQLDNISRCLGSSRLDPPPIDHRQAGCRRVDAGGKLRVEHGDEASRKTFARSELFRFDLHLSRPEAREERTAHASIQNNSGLPKDLASALKQAERAARLAGGIP
jgi:hypothetical protein